MITMAVENVKLSQNLDANLTILEIDLNSGGDDENCTCT
jgi:hypothetical protein